MYIASPFSSYSCVWLNTKAMKFMYMVREPSLERPLKDEVSHSSEAKIIYFYQKSPKFHRETCIVNPFFCKSYPSRFLHIYHVNTFVLIFHRYLYSTHFLIETSNDLNTRKILVRIDCIQLKKSQEMRVQFLRRNKYLIA